MASSSSSTTNSNTVNQVFKFALGSRSNTNKCMFEIYATSAMIEMKIKNRKRLAEVLQTTKPIGEEIAVKYLNNESECDEICLEYNKMLTQLLTDKEKFLSAYIRKY